MIARENKMRKNRLTADFPNNLIVEPQGSKKVGLALHYTIQFCVFMTMERDEKGTEGVITEMCSLALVDNV